MASPSPMPSPRSDAVMTASQLEDLGTEFPEMSTATVVEVLLRATSVVELLGGNERSRGWIYLVARDRLELLRGRRIAAQERVNHAAAARAAAPSARQRRPADGAAEGHEGRDHPDPAPAR